MIKINVNDAKTNLSKYLRSVEQGEVVVLCRHNKPVAEIRPIDHNRPPRVFGVDEGKGYDIPQEFFDPLDHETLAYFSGERP